MIVVPWLGADPERHHRPIRTGRRDRPIIQLPSIALRVTIVVGVAAVLFSVIFFRLWFLQILSGEEFIARADNQRLKSVKIVAQRGDIVDRRGEVIVTTRGAQLVGIRLMDVPEGRLDELLESLAPHLRTKPGDLRRRIMRALRPSTYDLQPVEVAGGLNEGAVATATRVRGKGTVIAVTMAEPLPAEPRKGSLMTLANLRPAAYNGSFTVSSVKDASHFRLTLPRDPGEDASATATSTATESRWISFLTWEKVVDKEITGVDLIPLKEDVSRRERTYVQEHTLAYPGIEVADEYLRAYPRGSLAAQVLGRVGPISAEELASQHFKGYLGGDQVGHEGLEYTYDRWLRGRDGVAKVQVDAHGRPRRGGPVPGGRLAQPGNVLVTTLDATVQAAAERALRDGISRAIADGEWGADGGAAVVLDVRNGDVLALANHPTYDPSVFVGGISDKKYKRLFVRKSTNYPLLNRSIMESKAVGSTFKAITAIAGLEEGAIVPGTTEWCPGDYSSPYDNAEDPQIFKCWATDGHGHLDLAGALAQSCDVYFYNLGSTFYGRQGEPLADWAKRLGMGRPTGIDILGEAAGRVPTPGWKKRYFSTEIDRAWKPGDSVQMSVGQGYLEATPLQLAVAYAAVANGGRLVTPHLGLKIIDSAGRTVRNLQPSRSRKVDISTATLDAVRRGLYEAAHAPAGTSAPIFYNYKIPVAGKTGTAEVWDSSVKRLVNYAWYASYAPFDNPRYAVVVMIEKGGHGATTAAPATRLIYDALFHIDSGTFSGPIRGD